MTMSNTRNIDVFSAECPACQKAIELVNNLACPTCEVRVLQMHDPDVARQTERLDIRSVPAIAIDGKLASCCEGRGPDEALLRSDGLGRSV